jgi:hypothetical protein
LHFNKFLIHYLDKERIMLRKMTGIAAAIALGAVASVASAGLVVDVRLAGGGKSINVVDGQDVQIQLWAQVHGSDANVLNDGLSNLYTAIGSTVVTPGVAGSMTSFALQTAWANATGSQQGVAADFNGDGVGDWGSNSAVSTDRPNYILAIDDLAPSARFGNSSPTATANQLADGYEFLIGTGVFHVTTATGGETDLNALKPAWTTANPKYSTYTQDGTSLSASNTANQLAFGAPVTLVTVPEPATMSILGLGLCGLIARRRHA